MPSIKNFINERDALARRLAHTFNDWTLLDFALTHKSAGKRRARTASPEPNPTPDSSLTSPHPVSGIGQQPSQHVESNNERLEFLGDAVLGMVIANELFESHTELEQDGLSLIRASLVNKDALARIARTLELGRAIRLGPGELRSGGHNRSSILADALEAVIGAVFLDAGYLAARDLILRLFESSLASASVTKDAKTRLQEWLQSRRETLPVYSVAEVTGADHARHYQVRCDLPGRTESALGTGRSRRAAEQSAAHAILEVLNSATSEEQKA